MAFSYQLLLNGLICREQDDDPEFLEDDEIYFLTTTTTLLGAMTQTHFGVFPSDKQIPISENESIANTSDPNLSRWRGAVIASGPLVDRVILSVYMLEFDGSIVADVIRSVSQSVPSIPIPVPDIFDVSKLPQLAAGAISPILDSATTDPLLGSFTVQITNGATPEIKWIPGPGLNQLPGWNRDGNGTDAAWSFVDYSEASYEAAFRVTFGA